MGGGFGGFFWILPREEISKMQSNFFEIAYVYYVLLSLNEAEAEQLGLIVEEFESFS